MKKLIHCIILLICFCSFSQNKDSKQFLFKDINVANIKVGELNKTQLDSLKTYLHTNYNKTLDSIDFIKIA